MNLKEILQDLVDAALACEAGRELDAGCDGDGPLAKAMVKLKMAKNTEEATDIIYG